MSNEPANNNMAAHSQKLKAEIKKTWGKLTDEEIGFQASQQDKFYDAVKTKYSINKDEAEKTVKKLDAECAEAVKNAAKSDTAPAAVTPKAANA